MNVTRLLVLALCFVATATLSAETVIDQLYGQRAYDLADAYWSAGQKFVDLGQADRGAEFKARALKIFPGYVPGQAPAVTVAQTAPVEAAPVVPDISAVREKNLQGEKIARLQFQKLLRGYLTGNSATVASVLAPSVTLQGQSSPVDAPAVAAFLEQNPAEAGSPDELFLTDTLDVTDGAGQSVLVKVMANPEAPAGLEAQLPFWRPDQTYTFDRVGDTWKLVRVEGR